MSSLKVILSARFRGAASTSTLAHGVTPPLGMVLDGVAKRDPSYHQTLTFKEVYDIFGIEQGDSLALARRLLRERWPGVAVVDKQPELPRQKTPTVAQIILINEIDGLKQGCRAEIQQLRMSGCTVDQIAIKTGISRKHIKAVIDGGEITDEGAASIHLTASGKAKPGHSKAKLLQALKTRISRARKAIRSTG